MVDGPDASGDDEGIVGDKLGDDFETLLGLDIFRFRLFAGEATPSCLALDLANRNPHLHAKRFHQRHSKIHVNDVTHALHSSFLPLGPFLHSGLCVV